MCLSVSFSILMLSVCFSVFKLGCWCLSFTASLSLSLSLSLWVFSIASWAMGLVLQIHPCGPEDEHHHHQHWLQRSSRAACVLPGACGGASANRAPAPGRPGDQPHLPLRHTLAAARQEVVHISLASLSAHTIWHRQIHTETCWQNSDCCCCHAVL